MNQQIKTEAEVATLPDETRPGVTRRKIVKELRQHSQFVNFLLEKYPGIPDGDELLRLKLDLVRAINELT